MKLQRPGYTETDLMFCQYLKNIGIEDNIVKNTEDNFILWLYKNAGWYDMDLPCRGVEYIKNCIINKNEFISRIKNSYVYDYWKKKYYYSLYNSDFLIPLCHRKNFENYYDQYYQQFITSLNHKNDTNTNLDNFWCRYSAVYGLISRKNVLVVSSFANLIQSQFDSKNIYRIYNDFPEINNLFTYQFPYTFFNTGPHNNSIETLNIIFSDISKINFDIMLIGAGCYGCLLVNMVHDIGKIGVTMGSNISDFFGINPKKQNEYWIHDIPQQYIPEGYNLIDYGKYWIDTECKSKY